MQNIVVLLCHFCEGHGPKIVMTSQPMCGLPTHRKGVKNGEAPPINPQKRPQFYGDSLLKEVVDRDQRCAACSSFGSGLGMVSNDHDAKTSYLSTQLPVNERVHQIAKEMCLRSLSVEISTPLFVETEPSTSKASMKPPIPTRAIRKPKYRVIKEINDSEHSGVVLYGDQENGYTLSYTFKLSDSKARGFKRLYAFLAITSDKMFLLNRYDFFLRGFSSIINKLQAMADKNFTIEQSQTNGDVPLDRAINRMVYLPQNFFPRKFAGDTSRSLTAIVNDDEVFHTLHRQILCLLRIQTTLVKDVVLEGVPTQDMLVALERDPESLEETDLITSLTTTGANFHVHNLQLIAWRFLGTDSRHLVQLIWTILIGDQLIVKSDDASARKFFLLAVAHLLPVGCVRIVSDAATYTNQYKNNFVGCPLNAEIPEEGHENSFIVSLHPKSSSDTKNDLDSYVFNVERFVRHVGPRPLLLTRYLFLLKERRFSASVINASMKQTRIEWLNRAKIVFQLSRQRNKVDLDRVVKIIRCEPQDSPVLLFLQAGLSRHYRQVVFNTIKSAAKLPRPKSNDDSLFKRPR